MVKDPVCGMNVNLKTTKWSTEYHKGLYYFCCEKCLDDFSMDPEFYLNGNSEEHDCDNCSKGGCNSKNGCINTEQIK